MYITAIAPHYNHQITTSHHSHCTLPQSSILAPIYGHHSHRTLPHASQLVHPGTSLQSSQLLYSGTSVQSSHTTTIIQSWNLSTVFTHCHSHRSHSILAPLHSHRSYSILAPLYSYHTIPQSFQPGTSLQSLQLCTSVPHRSHITMFGILSHHMLSQ